MYYIYILKCDDQSFYVGLTDNLERRLAQHQNKRSLYTKRYSNIKLVYSEKFHKRIDAEQREQQLKGWSRAKKEALISDNKNRLIKLSKSKSLAVDG